MEYWTAVRNEDGDIVGADGTVDTGDFLYMGSSKAAAIKAAREAVVPEGCTVGVERVTSYGTEADGVKDRTYADVAWEKA